MSIDQLFELLCTLLGVVGVLFPLNIYTECCHLTLAAHRPDGVCQIVSSVFACIGHQLDKIQPNLATVG